jgi:acyl carrier protein
MVESTEIVARVTRIVARIAGPLRTPPDAGPQTALGDHGFWLDSVALLEVILACEEEFGLAFDPAEDFRADHLRTVQTLADVVCAKVPA